MAQRRMFSPDVVCSDAFLEMPPSTQALYFQLGMKGDDDGFVNPKMVMRMIGSVEDELRVLVAKRFVIQFPNGVLVIKHWKMNNLVRKDWYRPTVYLEEKSQLFEKENGAYTLDESQGKAIMIESGESRQRFVNEPSTQVRLGKVRKGKDIQDIVEETSTPPVLGEATFELWWKEYPSTKRNVKKDAALKKFTLGAKDEAEVTRRYEHLKKQKSEDRKWVEGFIPNMSTYLNQARWDCDIEPLRNATKNVLKTEHSNTLVNAIKNKTQ